MVKPRNPNDTHQLSEAVRLNLILPEETLPPVFVSLSTLVEDMDDDMQKVFDKGTVQAHYSVDRLINGEWKALGENDFTEKNHDELKPLIDEWHRNAVEDAFGRFNKRHTVQYAHVPITSGRKLLAATLRNRTDASQKQ